MSDADFHYPPIDERGIKLALRIYESNPGYLDDPMCPYGQELKDLFKGQAKVHDFNTHNTTEVADGDQLVYMINQLSKELKDYGKFVNDDEEATAQDKNTYFRLSTSLLDKQIEQREKIMNIKQYEALEGFLLNFMDKEMDADQRNLFIKGIKMLGGLLTTSTSSATPEFNKNKTEGANEISNPVPPV